MIPKLLYTIKCQVNLKITHQQWSELCHSQLVQYNTREKVSTISMWNVSCNNLVHTLLNLYIGPNPSLQNRLVRWRVPLFINYSRALSLINVGLGFSNIHNWTRGVFNTCSFIYKYFQLWQLKADPYCIYKAITNFQSRNEQFWNLMD
jgi:hypothetical protein